MSQSRVRATLSSRNRSALGIKRISDADVAQVLHASQSDIDILQSKLHQWGVSEFRSYPLLLRALTHPSISNWAERTLDLPKRSLGPNTLELLGDRVLGATTAYRVLEWTRQRTPRSDVDWTGGPRTVLRTLLGNRGLAETARSIGIESLIRWEKPLPPASHRPRLDSLGIDIATGVQSNVEVNGLAAAYESVASAIYLDGGFEPALSFVDATLLRQPLDIQHDNRECSDYEAMLSTDLVPILGSPVTTATFRPRATRKTILASGVIIDVLEFQQEASEHVNKAHTIFYAGVSIRRTSEAFHEVDEGSLISLASHFSVESARLAALKQAVAVIRGEAHPNVDQPLQRLRDERIVMRSIISDKVPTLTVKVNPLGQWQFERDYANVANVLGRAGSPAFEASKTMDANQVRTTLQARYRQRISNNGEGKRDQFDHSSKNSATPMGIDILSPRSRPYQRNTQVHSGFEVDAVEKALQVGQKVFSNLELTSTYNALLEDVRPASDVVGCLDNAVQEMNCLGRHHYLKWLNAYHALGNQSIKLWAVQRSIENVAEDRAQVAPRYEHRIGLACILEDSMLGTHGLEMIRNPGVRRGCVALGVCTERMGMATTLAWLTGEEASIK